MARPLEVYERLLSTMSVNLCVQGALPKSPHVLRDAFVGGLRLASQEHPFLRMSIVDGTFVDGGAHFDELVTHAHHQEIDEESGTFAPSRSDLRLARHANVARDATRGTFWLHVDTWDDDDQNETLVRFEARATVCHAASDGRGVFVLFDAVLRRTAAVISGDVSTEFSARAHPFRNICADIYAQHMDRILELGPAEQPSPDNVLGPAPHQLEKGGIDSPPQFDVVVVRLTRDETETIRQRCRESGASLQALLTLASSVATIVQHTRVGSASRDSHAWAVFPMIAKQMRDMIDPPIGDDECVAGGSGVSWVHPLKADESLMMLAAETRDKFRERILADAHLQFLYLFLGERQPAPPPAPTPNTQFATNVGELPLSTPAGWELREATMCGGSMGPPRRTPPIGGSSLHAYVFQNRLSVTLTFVRPVYSHDWARAFGATLGRVLRAFLTDEASKQALGEFVTRELDQ